MFEEPGAEAVSDRLDRGATASAIILQEVATRLHREGYSAEDVAETIETLGLTAADHTPALAMAAAALYPATRGFGLSHGDRSCLALAGAMGVTAVTGDRAWAEAGAATGVAVEMIR